MPRCVHRVQPGDRERAAEAACPARAGRRRSRRSRRARDRVVRASCSFSQLKPARPSASNASRNSVGSNHGSAMRALQRRLGPAALFGVAGERAVVHREPRGVVAAGLERRGRVTPAGQRRRARDRERRRASRRASRAGRNPTVGELGVVGVGRAEDPARERAAAVRGDVRDRGAERARRGRGVGRARRRSRDDARASSRRDRRCRCGRRARTRASSTRKPAESGAGLLEVAPHRVAERVVAVGRARAARRARRSRSRRAANSAGSTRVERRSVVTARGYPPPVARPRGAKARATAVVEMLARAVSRRALRARTTRTRTSCSSRRSSRRSAPTSASTW